MRYYYSDPLAAAWMAKHFGMRFKHDLFEQEECANTLTALLKSVGMGDISMHAKHYIVTESLHLLDPVLLDLIKDDDGIGILENDKFKPPKSIKIIQRNGIPFHWPEVES